MNENCKWDIFGDFQTPCLDVRYFYVIISVPPPVSKVIQVTQKRLTKDGFHTCKCETFFMCILHLNEEKLPVRNNPCCDVEYYEKGWHTFLLLSRVRKPIRYPPDIPHPVESLAWHLYLVFCIQDILHTVAKSLFCPKIQFFKKSLLKT